MFLQQFSLCHLGRPRAPVALFHGPNGGFGAPDGRAKPAISFKMRIANVSTAIRGLPTFVGLQNSNSH
jgi:hypothetical protein